MRPAMSEGPTAVRSTTYGDDGSILATEVQLVARTGIFRVANSDMRFSSPAVWADRAACTPRAAWMPRPATWMPRPAEPRRPANRHDVLAETHPTRAQELRRAGEPGRTLVTRPAGFPAEEWFHRVVSGPAAEPAERPEAGP